LNKIVAVSYEINRWELCRGVDYCRTRWSATSRSEWTL